MADTSSGYPCFHCPQIFPQQSGLASHVLSKHMGCKEEELSSDESPHDNEDQESDDRSIHNPATEGLSDMSALKEECPDSMSDKDDHFEDTKVFVVNEVKNIHEDMKIQCSRCGLQLSDYNKLKAHIETVHLALKPHKTPSDRYSVSSIKIESPDYDSACDKELLVHKCHYCDECFLSKSLLKQHKKEHSADERLFVCKVCNKYFAQKHKLRVHEKVHSNDMSYSCKVCSCCFKRKNGLQNHMKTTHNVPCKNCKKTFLALEDLKSHVCENKAGVIVPPTLVCETCGKSFKLKEQLKRHLTTHEKSRHLTCQFCCKALVSQNSYDKHMEVFHSGKEAPFQCEECGKRYWNKNALSVHTKSTHQQIFLYHCKHCDKGYYSKTLLEGHERKHTGEKPFQCKDCDQTFISKHNLLTHQERNHQEKTLLCPQCPKTFSVMKLLDSHIFNKHSDEKPFSCDQCSYTCKTAGNLKIHSRKHSDERPYECDVCGKGYKLPNHLKTHQKAHAK